MPLEECGIHCQECLKAWYIMVTGKMNLENVWIYSENISHSLM